MKTISRTFRKVHFTFHNVSITTFRLTPAVLWMFRSLHSTMSLLQPRYRKLHRKSLTLYIPQCLYYNLPLPARTLLRRGNFTFHNVSITTMRRLEEMFCNEIFTFHNVSITTIYQMRYLRRLTRLYIPQCLYYNQSNVL